MMRSFISTNGDYLSKQFLAATMTLQVVEDTQVRHYGRILLQRVKQKASGRPGPEVRTGKYRSRMYLRVFGLSGGGRGAVVGNLSPQARRLELGFHGRDSLGRKYNQPPYPHFGPAIDEVGREFLADLDRTITTVIGSI